MLLRENWGLAWSGLAIAIGVVYLFRAFRERGQEGAIFAAVVLVVMGLAILIQLLGWTSFAVWRLWPLFFGAIGLGLVFLWALKESGLTVLSIGGILLVAFGYGLASPSWYRYLRDLRRFFDYWPLLALVVGLVLIYGFWKRRSLRGVNNNR